MSDQQFPFDKFLKSNNSQSINPFLKGQAVEEEKSSNIEAPESTEIKINNDFNEITGKICSHVSSSIPEQKYKTYFENTFKVTSLNEGLITFTVTTPFIKTMIELNYNDLINEVVEIVLGYKLPYQIEVSEAVNTSLSSNTSNILHSLNESESDQFSTQNNNTPKNVKEAKFTLDLTPNKDEVISKIESERLKHEEPLQDNQIVIDKDKTFDDFIVGPSNNLAFATAKAVADGPGKKGKYPCLYIHSNSGLGKTHLLHAMANSINDKYPTLRITLITAREFMREMINAYRTQSIDQFRKKFSEHVDVLMIDDIHELKNKEGTQDEFFHIFNELHNKGKQLVFTSDKHPNDITGITERIKTRLQWGLVLDIQKPDLETRIAILRKKSSELDLYLPEDVINLISIAAKSSIRELEGLLSSILAYTDIMNIDIDTEAVKNILKIDENAGSEKIVTMDSITKAVSNYYKVPVADIKSKARGKGITHARHVAIYLTRKLIKSTQKEIGMFFGGRDHTSIIHSYNKIERDSKKDNQLSQDIIYIENNL